MDFESKIISREISQMLWEVEKSLFQELLSILKAVSSRMSTK